jgi:hypothetical protein
MNDPMSLLLTIHAVGVAVLSVAFITWLVWHSPEHFSFADNDSIIIFTIACWPIVLFILVVFSLPYMAIYLLYAKLKVIRDRRIYKRK